MAKKKSATPTAPASKKAGKQKPAAKDFRPVASNRKAHFDYEILERYEAGISLTGTEIKSIRAGKIDLRDSYARASGGEMWLHNAYMKIEEQKMSKSRGNFLRLQDVAKAPDDARALGLLARWAANSRDGDMVGGDFPAWLVGLVGLCDSQTVHLGHLGHLGQRQVGIAHGDGRRISLSIAGGLGIVLCPRH